MDRDMFFGGAGVATLRVELHDVEPAIWRRFTIDTRAPLPALHTTLVVVMGWEGYHLHGFRVGHLQFGPAQLDLSSQIDEADLIVEQLLGRTGAALEWDYDFGDSWTHTVVVESIAELGYDSELHQPTCLDGARACPPEDCGGTWGYADLLEILADPKHPEHDERADWLGRPFDPEAFEPSAVSEALLAT